MYDKLDKNHLKVFIEDTYVFLTNHQGSSDDETYGNGITDLLQRCKLIMDKLNLETDNDANNNADDNLDECYLEMNSKISDNEYMTCNNNSNDSVEDDTLSYHKTNLSGNDDDDSAGDPDKNDITNSDGDDDNDVDTHSIPCPYSGLPAAHLVIKNSQKCGFINRIGKRLFFEQNRKYYAGVLTKWLLLYPNGQSDLKPSTHLYINRLVTIDKLCETKNKKKLYVFRINYFNNKKYLFQTQNEEDLNEWLKVLNEVRELNYRDEFNMLPPFYSLSMVRKLPTPPPDADVSSTTPSTQLPSEDVNDAGTKELHESCYHDSSNSDEDDIYEEPKILFDYNNFTVCDNKMICYVNGKKIEYDIPKTTAAVNAQLEESRANDCHELVEISKVRDKIESELVLLMEKPKLPVKKESCTTTSHHVTSSLTTTTTCTTTTASSSSSVRTPVKQWFKNRLTMSLNKETAPAILSISPPQLVISPTKSPIKIKPNATMGFGGVEKSPPKGVKINMIINQLEANGHLPLISKNFNERRNTMLYEDYLMVGKG